MLRGVGTVIQGLCSLGSRDESFVTVKLDPPPFLGGVFLSRYTGTTTATTASTNSTTETTATTKAIDTAEESHTAASTRETQCRRQPEGVGLHQGESQTHPPSGNLEMETVKRKTQDIPLQADKEAETEMTALPLVATEETVVMGTVQRAVAAGTAAKIETAMMMMRMKSPDTVAWEQAAHHQAKKGTPPRKTKLLRQKNCRAKNTGKTGTPAIQPPAKGASRRKAKMPRHKFPGFLQAKAQYTGPCLRAAIWYPSVDRKKPSTVPSSYPQEGSRDRKHYKTWAIRTGHGNGHTRQEERDTW